MKCVILAGGKGTRIAEESNTRPKPMVEIGSKPILWHIMKLYASHGVTEFVVCLGYKGYMIKEYFANYFLHQADVTFDMAGNRVEYHDCRSEPWKVTLVDTGEDSMTGGRLLHVGKYLTPGEPFCMTYGDGLSDVDITAEIAFHKERGCKATVACVRPPARFGRIVMKGTQVVSFEEKPQTEGGLINGGFFVLEPGVLELIEGSHTVWENEPLETLAGEGQLAAWIHRGFWQPMDTLRDKQTLNTLWESGTAPGSGGKVDAAMVGLVTGCRSCGGRLAVTMADLGMQPPSNAFLTSIDQAAGEKRYPLRAKVCESCKLVQVDYDVDPKELFGNYVYFSSYADEWLAHAKAYCDMARQRFSLTGSSLVVELASNDGYLLKNFLNMGVPVLGVDPSDTVAAAARKIGVPTLVEFFGTAVAERLVAQGQSADLIIGNNVLAHVPLLNDFIAGMALLLKPAGTVTIEFPHLLTLIDQVAFDTIYHEHYSYLSLFAIEQVFARHGLRIYDVEELPTHGGSLRIFASHAKHLDVQDSDALRAVRHKEHLAGLPELPTYLRFAERVEECRRSMLRFFAQAKREGKTVGAYGAAAKGNTLLNFCGAGRDDIFMVADRNPHKQSKLLPGTHIPVVSPEELMRAKPDYVLILPWNLKDEIRRQLRDIADWGGRFVTPVPVAAIDP